MITDDSQPSTTPLLLYPLQFPFKKYFIPLWQPEGLEAIAIEAIEAATTPLTDAAKDLRGYLNFG